MPVATRGSSKRARDDSETPEDERPAKRPTTPFFRRVEPTFQERARTARKATPARVSRPVRPYSAAAGARFRDPGNEDLPQLMPTGEDEPAPKQAQATPATPLAQREQKRSGWLWDSVRKWVPGLSGQTPEPVANEEDNNNARSASPSPSDRAVPRRGNEDLARNPYPRLLSPGPEPEPELTTYQRLMRIHNTVDDFEPIKRNKRLDFAAASIAREERQADRYASKFSTKQVPGSNKRKITNDAEPPSVPSHNSFQVPTVEDEDEEENGDEKETTAPDDAESLLRTPEKQQLVAATPLKSAMRTGTKSKLNVGFDESTIKSTNEPEMTGKWPNYGDAGNYTGTTFLDPMDPKNKKHFQKVIEERSPVTNSDPRFMAPNTFGIADEDLEYTLTPEEEAQVEALQAAEAAEAAQPPTAPRPAHAELPTGPCQAEADGVAPDTGSQSAKASDSQKILDEQRARANKYKPKKSSGLSHVEPARSRSSSPPRAVSTTVTASADGVPALSDGDGSSSDEPVSPTPPASKPLAGDIGSTVSTALVVLDDTKVGDDGLTDYGREHQYDEWAAGLDWPEPQTYVDAGVCSAYIDDLLRKKWTNEDERITQDWWQREFEDVDRQMESAKKNGQQLALVYGEDAEGIA